MVSEPREHAHGATWGTCRIGLTTCLVASACAAGTVAPVWVVLLFVSGWWAYMICKMLPRRERGVHVPAPKSDGSKKTAISVGGVVVFTDDGPSWVEVHEGTTHRDVLQAACRNWEVDWQRFALLTYPDRGGVKSNGAVKELCFETVERDECGGDPRASLVMRWTAETAEWLLPYSRSEPVGMGRVRLLLSHVDVTSSGGICIVNAVNKGANCTDEELVAKFADKTKEELEAMGADTLRWMVVEEELNKLLPAEGTTSPEETLKKMQKLKTETLLEFVMRYKERAATYVKGGKVSQARSLHILFRKLPRQIQVSLYDASVDSANLDLIVERVRNWIDWIRIGSKDVIRGKDELGDYMDVDFVQLEEETDDGVDDLSLNAARDRVVPQGKIDFTQVKNANTLMIAWKVLMKEEKYRTEAEKFLASGNQEKGPRKDKESARRSHRIHACDDKDLEHREECYSLADSSEQESLPPPVVCAQMAPVRKPSMHLPVWIRGVKLDALVDTGATSNFIQTGLMYKLKLGDLAKPCSREVRFGNGLTQKIPSELEVSVRIHEEQFPTKFYCIEGKGPSLILGLPFFSDNGFDINCKEKTLTKTVTSSVQCNAVETSEGNPSQKNCVDLETVAAAQV